MQNNCPHSTLHLNGLLSKARKFLLKKVLEFLGRKPFPTLECTVTLFITYLAPHKISLATIKVYLSAVWHMHLYRGLHDHLNQQLTLQFYLILRGIKRRQAGRHLPH